MRKSISVIVINLFVVMMVSCSPSVFQVGYIDPEINTDGIEVWSLDSDFPAEITPTPFLPELSSEMEENLQSAAVIETRMPAQEIDPVDGNIHLWVESYVPEDLKNAILASNTIVQAQDYSEADSYLLSGDNCSLGSDWVYALAAPFPTVVDEFTIEAIRDAWSSGESSSIGGYQFVMTSETEKLLDTGWGDGKDQIITIATEDQLLDIAWGDGNSLAILPFEKLSPRWKVLKINGISPLDQQFMPDEYALTFHFCLNGLPAELVDSLVFPLTNRDSSKFTSVILTGVTALVRATAYRMENNGIFYPGEKIESLLFEADFTHISNEVAFAVDCPYPDPYQTDLRFCSNPDYIELLTHLDIDIVELTGNHIQDWSRQAFVETLGRYTDAGILYYAGGVDEAEARKPLLIEHNGNKIAFLGCNAVGPTGAWASSSTSGNSPCGDYQWLIEDIQSVIAMGYLPIVTLQHNEFYSLVKTGPQSRDFDPLAEAGAVIVSGSQAHYPNPFGFVGDHFIHYGLGNLFFDQMDVYIADGIQREFVDRHIFYDGRYISVEVYTLHLEDFAQPRIMTALEREAFLKEAFLASGWK